MIIEQKNIDNQLAYMYEMIFQSTTQEKGIERALDYLSKELDIKDAAILLPKQPGIEKSYCRFFQSENESMILSGEEYASKLSKDRYFTEAPYHYIPNTDAVNYLGSAYCKQCGFSSVMEIVLRNHGYAFGYLIFGFDKKNPLDELSVSYLKIMGDFLGTACYGMFFLEPKDTNVDNVLVEAQSNRVDVSDIEEDFRMEHAISLFERMCFKLVLVGLETDTYQVLYSEDQERPSSTSYQRGFLVSEANRIIPEEKADFVSFLKKEALNKKFIDGTYYLKKTYHYDRGFDENREVKVTAIFVDLHQGNNRRFLLMMQDITEESEVLNNNIKELDDALTATISKLELMSNAMSTLSHDIRTPLNAISIMSRLLEKENDNEDLDKYVDSIRQAALYMVNTLDDMIEISWLDNGKLTLKESNFDIKRMLESIDIALRQSAEERHVEFEIVEDYYEQIFYGDNYRLQQVLLKLLSSGIETLEAGGHTSLTVEKITRENNHVIMRFNIHQQGSGINIKNMISGKQDAGAKKRGTSMDVCQAIVKLLGGELIVETASQNEISYQFMLSLKLGDEKALRHDAAVEEEEDMIADYSGLSVLLVEDNDFSADTMSLLLENMGFDVDVAEDGKQGVITYVGAEDNYYSLVIMNLQMPVMDGYEAAHCIRISGKENCEQIPIIGLTANAMMVDTDKIKESGMNDFITKPVDVDEFHELLATYIPKEEI